jgi:hypothetical protein
MNIITQEMQHHWVAVQPLFSISLLLESKALALDITS